MAKPFAIYVHDLDKTVEVDAANGALRIIEGNGQYGPSARYVMCSQVVWFTFAFPYGPDTTQVSGMYLDRQFGKQVKNEWHRFRFFWLQEKLSSEVFRLTGINGVLRTVHFWWRKKGEKFYQYAGKFRGQDTDDE